MKTNYIEDKIIEMRLDKSYIRTIKAWVVKSLPLLDCQVCLSRVLTTLDKQNLPYSRNEVRKAFDVGYEKDAHGDKRSYINWLCQNCSKKVVHPEKLKSRLGKPHGKNKKPVPCVSDTYKARSTRKSQIMSVSKGKGQKAQNSPQTAFKIGSDVGCEE